MGRATSAFKVGSSFGEVEEVDFVVGEVEERSVGLRLGLLGEWEHEPWELRREVGRDLWDRDSPRVTYGLESEVVGVNCEILGYCFQDVSRELGPVNRHFYFPGIHVFPGIPILSLIWILRESMPRNN